MIPLPFFPSVISVTMLKTCQIQNQRLKILKKFTERLKVIPNFLRYCRKACFSGPYKITEKPGLDCII